jgi:branched-chain amino acid transport system ATP-binding protein
VVVGLLGRNGVGKSTTALTFTGVVSVNHGSIYYQGQDITNLEPAASRRLGLSIVPQGRRIFPNLTVLENLHVARDPQAKGVWSVEKVFELVPRLGERQNQLGRYLSGGEQQLLALCRGLMRPTDLLILDEPTEGLSPTMTQLVVDTIKRLISETELSLLLIEQRIDVALELTDRLYLMNNGIITRDGPTTEFSDNLDHLYARLGVGN